MSMRLALLGEPPPARHWDDPDLDSPAPAQPPPFAFQWACAGPLRSAADSALVVVAASAAGVALCRQLLSIPRDEPHCGWGTTLAPVASLGPQPQEAVRSAASDAKSGQAEIFASSDRCIFVVVVDGFQLPPENCYLWTRALFGQIKPQRVVVLGPLPSGQFHGLLRSRLGVDDLAGSIFLLETARIQENQQYMEAAKDLPWLPCGALVEGLPASVLSYCEARAVEATLCCCAPATPSPNASLRSAALALLRFFKGVLPTLGLNLPVDAGLAAVRSVSSALSMRATLSTEMYA